ncbi:anti-sigma factor family protein [Streptomyces sp. CA-294286]|uniref:anti-sigma factor family protein n=1 Tax=Streptomyces sp. CA-294286 TaxID=3240070 RepID=UPI003D9503EC
MSGSRPTPAEQHLGDRLAALVDGELGHDSRERVLAHLATCAKCKAEADAQRRLKDVFAHTASPAPSEGFLARLQGLPGGSGDEDDPEGGGPFGRGRFGDGAAGVFSADDSLRFGSRIGYEPTGAHGPVFPGGSGDRGFRIHEVGRPQGERSGGRRPSRFAFAAASAVSLAAIALGGALPADSANSPSPRGERSGGFTPARAATPASGTDNSRRQGGASSVRGDSGSGSTSGGGRSVLSATTGVGAGAATAPPVPYQEGLKVFPISLPPREQGNHGLGPGTGPLRHHGIRPFPAHLPAGSVTSPPPGPVHSAPTTSPSAPAAGGHLAVPPAPELSVAPGR